MPPPPRRPAIMITGATDGIGRQTALDLATQGHTILLHGRDAGRVNRTVTEIQEISGNPHIQPYVADFTSLEQVRRMAGNIRRQHERLNVLINNAGVFETDFRKTEDGFEKTFAVNHLAHFLLTLSLVDLMKQSAPARIITVSSMMHANEIDFDNLNGEKGFWGLDAYALSKLCNVMFTYELADRLAGTGVTANCLHPGVVDTKLLRKAFGGGSPVSQGSACSVYLATAAEVEGVSGEYFSACRRSRSSAISRDAGARKRLWEISWKWAGLDNREGIGAVPK